MVPFWQSLFIGVVAALISGLSPVIAPLIIARHRRTKKISQSPSSTEDPTAGLDGEGVSEKSTNEEMTPMLSRRRSIHLGISIFTLVIAITSIILIYIPVSRPFIVAGFQAPPREEIQPDNPFVIPRDEWHPVIFPDTLYANRATMTDGSFVAPKAGFYDVQLTIGTDIIRGITELSVRVGSDEVTLQKHAGGSVALSRLFYFEKGQELVIKIKVFQSDAIPGPFTTGWSQGEISNRAHLMRGQLQARFIDEKR